jgi:hypothetical protein
VHWNCGQVGDNPLMSPTVSSPERPRQIGGSGEYDDIPRANVVGRVLATTCTYRGCHCPIGACMVMICMLLLSISIAAAGLFARDSKGRMQILGDVTPNVAGLAPRGTEIAKRDNSMRLMLFDEKNNEYESAHDVSQQDIWETSGRCLSRAPPSDCSSLGHGVDHGHRRLLRPSQSDPVAPDRAYRPMPAASQVKPRRHLQTQHSGDDVLMCGAHNAYSPGVSPNMSAHNARATGHLAYTELFIFGHRGGGNVLTAPMMKAMCAWEDTVYADSRFSHRCLKVHTGACCRPPSLPRLVAALNDVKCQDLTTSIVDSTLGLLARCVAARDASRLAGNSRDAPRLAGSGKYNESWMQIAECGQLSNWAGWPGYDPLTIVGGRGPNIDGTWHYPSECGQAGHVSCRNRNADTNVGLVAEPFGLGADHVTAEFLKSWLYIDVPPSDANHKQLKQFLTDVLYYELTEPVYLDTSQDLLPMFSGPTVEINYVQIMSDLRWAGFSFVMVCVYMGASTRSVFIAVLAMLHILLSYFMTYAIYKSMTPWFPFLLWLGLFVISGIGADDVFVYYDAWRQSRVLLPSGTPLANRITWVHTRAAKAMFLTSFTTAGAFLSNIVSSAIPMCLFGVFMCLMVTINYVLVITLFPAVVAVHHVWFEAKEQGQKCKHLVNSVSLYCQRNTRPDQVGFADVPESSLPFTDTGQPAASDSCQAVFGSPRIAQHGEAYAPTGAMPGEHVHVGSTADPDITGQPKGFQAVTGKLRLVERGYLQLADIVYRFRRYICAFTCLLALFVFVFYTSQVQRATGAANIWPNDYMKVYYDRARQTGWPYHFETSFGCEPECETVFFTFGTVPADNGNKLSAQWDVKHHHSDQLRFDRGSLEFDPDFSLRPAAVQRWLLQFTDNARQLPLFKPRQQENAAVDGSYTYLTRRRSKFNLPPNLIETALSSGPNSPMMPLSFGGGCEIGDNFADCFDVWIMQLAAGFPAFPTRTQIMIDLGWPEPPHLHDKIDPIRLPSLIYEGDLLRSFTIVLQSTLDGTTDGRWHYTTRMGNWTLLQRFIDAQIRGDAVSFCENSPGRTDWCDPKSCHLPELNNDRDACRGVGGGGICEWTALPSIGAAPLGLQTGWFHAPWFICMATQDVMVSAAWQSGCIAVALAMCTLLGTTRSLLISLLSLIAIVTTLILVVGWLIFLGWELGEMEAMCLAISVGICVDFVCHHAHAYSHAPNHCETRAARVKHSLAEMGVSVISASVTTGTAALVLVVTTTMAPFAKFGTFLLICMTCSTVVSQLFFHALLAEFGPQMDATSPSANQSVASRAWPTLRKRSSSPSPPVTPPASGGHRSGPTLHNEGSDAPYTPPCIAGIGNPLAAH